MNTPLLGSNERTGLGLASLLGLLLVGSCSSVKTRGELMVAVTADMSIPKNMNQVQVEILDESGNKQVWTYPIKPEQLGKPMPGTLAIVPSNAGGQLVRVRLIAEEDTGIGDPTVRVVREATVKVPTDRTAMLPMPLRWLCDGHYVMTDDGSYQSDCGMDQTCAAGACVSALMDTTKLADYDPAKVFGGGNEQGQGGRCIDVGQCFGSTATLQPNSDCTLTLPDGASSDAINVTLVLGADGDGECVTGDNPRCFLPLDNDPQEGFQINGSSVVLPPAACASLAAGKIKGLALSTTCPTKDGSVPICGPWTDVTTASNAPSGATSDDGGSISSMPDAAASTGDSGTTMIGTRNCAMSSPTQTPQNVFYVIDESIDSTTMSALTSALSQSQAVTVAGTSVGLALIPGGCGVNPSPAAAFATLPNESFSSAVLSAQAATTPGAQLDSALAEAYMYATSGAGIPASVVPPMVFLFSSGKTGSCKLDTATLAQKVKTESSAGVPTFVIELATSADGTDPGTTLLTQIATAAGTTPQFVPTPTAPAIGAAMIAAAAPRECTYAFQGAQTDVQVSLQQGDAATGSVALTNVGGLAGCAQKDGFYFNTGSQTFTLCATSCSKVSPSLSADGASTAASARLQVQTCTTGAPSGDAGSPIGTGDLPCTTDAQCPASAPFCNDARQCVPGAVPTDGGASVPADASTPVSCDGVDGGAAPPDSGANVATPASCTACMQAAAGNTCDTCICQHCLAPEINCDTDSGCTAMNECAQSKACSTIASCYTAATCQTVIDQYGGPSGASAQHFNTLGACVMGACPGICKATP